jgi:hypothetical protein
MAEIGLLKIGDQVTITGQGGVFFVLHLNFETLSASLLPSDDSQILNDISVDTLALLPRPGPGVTGATI